ncbi:MAG TPA: DUF47 family protein [Defluviitaleaceae bacterium]|jgi:predicted phosphate transport protein (TIGR00153 family)|nr:DUF47 family protein [Candidatus Epulonipiscium sp.]HOQ16814.1 DUF47 family protein [Defluviitaleaceae bacterium]HPT75711.1 DUF47 family protein [Defluviitaleaceae bacterium]HQD50241.1 DUF47 family protein [Defluviitaleaceae bacterium]
MLLFKKEREMLSLVDKHQEAVLECYELFTEGLKELNEKGLNNKVEILAKKVGEAESKADSVRHEIIQSLLKGVLLPESRRELLKLIELTDEIANKCEEIIKQICLQQIEFMEEIKPHIREITEKTRIQLIKIRELVNMVFSNMTKAHSLQDELIDIERLESEVDDEEYNAIYKLFRMKVELARKNQLKSIIADIADISDIAEDISDMLEMIMVLRKV